MSSLPTRLRTIGAGTVVLGLTWALTSCSGSQAGAPTFDTVSRGDVSTGVSASGALAAKTSEQLGFAVGGKLTSVDVKVGQKVEAGDVLATIDSRAAEATLKQAEANVEAQSAVLAGSSDNPAVQNAAESLARARHVVLENEQQGAASSRADSKAVSRAKKQKSTDEDAKDDAEDAVDRANDACDDAKDLAEKAGEAAAADPTNNAAATIAASAATGATTACGAVGSAEAGVTAAKQRIAADETAIVTAEQRKRVDDAALDVAEANANAGVASAQGVYNSAVAARPHTLDQQQALVDAAQAQVDAAQKTLDDTTLKAPSAGTISAVNGSKGEYLSASSGTSALAPGSSAAIPGASGAGAASAAGAASPTRPGGTQFIVLSGLDQLQVVLPFEESDAAQIKKGQSVDVQLDAIPDLVAKGTVESIAPSATPISGVVSYYATVTLDSRDPRERDGQTANATVLTQERTAVLTVPNAAVRQQGGADTVVVYEPSGDQRTVSFEAGLVGPDRTEVVSGLNEGDRVVVPSRP
ncbi:efflux RND transporter periplasmic adaptor subunit [Microlunatus antarcticus]|uniref:HlyD family secretion protein n=1 Tax=Microlunatus antarcticus TaxID=53388 RepID=A0A7W5P5A8_9ACTN|nr:HlyD family efflux transporter periplasmic adaptor subunit [Microlunatus antarcticus]MBB3325087.1 HlyD family secretion protein [Microlunatus antarcticus]